MKHKRLISTIAAVILMAFIVTGCTESEPKSDSHEKGQALSEKAFENQSGAVPYPAEELKDSQERRNLKERLLRQNDPERIGYVYFVQFGEFLGYWTIKGKVSSTQSQMTPSDIMTGDMCGSGCSEHQILEAPGDDGSYGANEAGVFFFTTEGALIQLPEDAYVYADQPIAIGNIPELNGQGEVTGAEE